MTLLTENNYTAFIKKIKNPCNTDYSKHPSSNFYCKIKSTLFVSHIRICVGMFEQDSDQCMVTLVSRAEQGGWPLRWPLIHLDTRNWQQLLYNLKQIGIMSMFNIKPKSSEVDGLIRGPNFAKINQKWTTHHCYSDLKDLQVWDRTYQFPFHKTDIVIFA